MERDEVMPPPIPHPPTERVCFPKGLPWAPKVRYELDFIFSFDGFLKYKFLIYFFFNREKDIEHFLESSRSKFIGYTLGK